MIAQAENSQSITNDLFNELDEEMPLDANEDAEDQFSLSDNEKMAEDEHDGTEVIRKFHVVRYVVEKWC